MQPLALLLLPFASTHLLLVVSPPGSAMLPKVPKGCGLFFLTTVFLNVVLKPVFTVRSPRRTKTVKTIQLSEI